MGTSFLLAYEILHIFMKFWPEIGLKFNSQILKKFGVFYDESGNSVSEVLSLNRHEKKRGYGSRPLHKGHYPIGSGSGTLRES
jgi:hypothetical protein